MIAGHDIDETLRCRVCLTDLQYLARGHRVPCIPQVRARNRGRVARVLYDEAEKMRYGTERGLLLQLFHREIDYGDYEARMQSLRFAGDRAARAFLEATP